MGGSRLTIGLLMAAAVLASGCTSSPPSESMDSAPPFVTQPTPAQETPSPTPNLPATPTYPPGLPVTASTDVPDAQAMHQVMAEVQELGELDPAVRDELLENLRQTDPRLWPMVVRQVRANLAWRRQAEQREMAGARPDVTSAGTPPLDAPPADRTVMRSRPPRTGGPGPSAESFPGDAGLLRRGGRLPAADNVALPPGDAPGGNYPTTQPSTPAERTVRLPPADRQAADEPAGSVIAASYDSKSVGDWQAHLAEAIRALESEVAQSPQSDSEFSQQTRLRMMYLINSQRDEALRPIRCVAPAMQQFWSKELYGLATLLDTELISEPTRRMAEAKQHLGAAVSEVGGSCPLVVRNLAFVTEIQSYGLFKPFDKYEFVPGQKVLLYAEVDNFKSKETAKGFHTASRSSYQIFDSSGKRVAEHEFSTNEEHCHNPRRDFFIGYEFCLPKRIYPGKHVLQLTVVDLISEKIGQSLIEFTVKASDD